MPVLSMSMIRHARWLAAVLCAVLSWSAQAQPACDRQRASPVPPVLSSERSVNADMVVYFAPAQLARHHSRDQDGDGVPDKVQNTVAQLQAARVVYDHVFGMQGPLASPRYQGVDRIQVLVRDMNRLNGQVFSVPYYDAGYARGQGGCVLRFHVGTHTGLYNLTPAHELFHLYHFSQTQVQRAWLREGTARWAEDIFRPGFQGPRPLPRTAEALRAVIASSYEAGHMWKRLAWLVDPEGVLPVPAAALTAHRYVSGRPVLPDRQFHGAAFMATLFRLLGEEGERFARDAGFSGQAWNSRRRHAAELDAYIWRAIVQAARAHRQGPSDELDAFLAISLD